MGKDYVRSNSEECIWSGSLCNDKIVVLCFIIFLSAFKPHDIINSLKNLVIAGGPAKTQTGAPLWDANPTNRVSIGCATMPALDFKRVAGFFFFKELILFESES